MKTECTHSHLHAPHPPGYLEHASWAEEMMRKGYHQERCPGCGLWTIWKPRSRIPCGVCRIWIEWEEYIVNFGVCDTCFEDKCPCHEGNPKSCPLHRWPDINLAWAS